MAPRLVSCAAAAITLTNVHIAMPEMVDGSAGIAQKVSVAPGIEFGECPPPLSDEPVAPRLECGLVTVPLDYDNPRGKTIEIAVSRLPATDPARRKGVLLLSPGGAIGAGLNMPSLLSGQERLRENYDLIGVDPRGMARSSPVSCGLTPPPPTLPRGISPWPSPDGGIDQNVRYARQVAKACADDELLPHMTSVNMAKDMDRVRRALGEEGISYLGYYDAGNIGAMYASLYPNRTRQFVIDSVVHPERLWRGFFRDWGPATERRMWEFAGWAAERDGEYGLGAGSSEVRALYFELAAKLDTEPIEFGDGTSMNGNQFREHTRSSFYSDSAFPGLAELWGEVAKRRGEATGGRATTPIDLGGIGRQRPADVPPHGRYPAVPDDNLRSSMFAMFCGDAHWPRSVATYARDVRRDGAAYPVAGAMASNIWPCAFWPFEPRGGHVELLDAGPGKILVVQAMRDSGTPLDSGVAMREALGERARLVVVDIGGHVVTYGLTNNHSRCADRTATDFLVSGSLPARDVYCAGSGS